MLDGQDNIPQPDGTFPVSDELDGRVALGIKVDWVDEAEVGKIALFQVLFDVDMVRMSMIDGQGKLAMIMPLDTLVGITEHLMKECLENGYRPGASSHLIQLARN